MNEAVIVSTARTPIGNAYRGGFNATAGLELAAPVLRAVLERAEIEPGEVEELAAAVAARFVRQGAKSPSPASAKRMRAQTLVRGALGRAHRAADPPYSKNRYAP